MLTSSSRARAEPAGCWQGWKGWKGWREGEGEMKIWENRIYQEFPLGFSIPADANGKNLNKIANTTQMSGECKI